MTPLLEVDRLVAGYGDSLILQGVSLLVWPQEIVAIIGPNGAGKSTLLKAVFGLLKTRQGQARFQGRDISGLPPERLVGLGMSYVPQSSNVFPSMTVEENLVMGGYASKSNPAARIKGMYDMFPVLEANRRRKAGRLSGGQRQLLALARALMLEPVLLLLDEPSTGLAPEAVSTVFDQVRRIQEGGVSVVMVEQNARQALLLAQRGYILSGGQNRLDGPAADLLHKPEVVRLYLGG
ncbi:MAG: ABC transporter ATP-binding protein [SAR202 cluster bacterium]|nr:ABC transporter ATP-binding protein [SAR202 cluster bacterium]